MSHWKRITCSISLAVIVTALSMFFIEGGGQLLILGLFLEMLFGWVIVGDPEVFHVTEDAWGGNVAAYSLLTYVFSWVCTGVREAIRAPHSNRGEI